jgi:hypothetical protein
MTAYREAGLSVNMLKEDIEMNVEGMALTSSRINMINMLF